MANLGTLTLAGHSAKSYDFNVYAWKANFS